MFSIFLLSPAYTSKRITSYDLIDDFSSIEEIIAQVMGKNLPIKILLKKIWDCCTKLENVVQQSRPAYILISVPLQRLCGNTCCIAASPGSLELTFHSLSYYTKSLWFQMWIVMNIFLLESKPDTMYDACCSIFLFHLCNHIISSMIPP